MAPKTFTKLDTKRGLCYDKNKKVQSELDINPHSKEQFFEIQIWFNTKQAAEFLSRSSNAIRIAVHRRQLKAHKWRGRLYFKRKDLDKLLNASLLF